MTAETDFAIRFWGTRGSLPCPGQETLRYGGNTTTLEISAGQHTLLIDAGSGMRRLGADLLKRGVTDVDLMFTHTHFDHICGLPFFAPAYVPFVTLRMWAGHLLQQDKTLHHVLEDMMIAPLFPVPLHALQNVHYRDFSPGDVLSPKPGLDVRTGVLNHPNGSTGYRVEWGGRSIAVITDTEHPEEGVDATVVELAKGADLMIYDAMYTDEIYPKFVGWGHSTWQKCLETADAAGVGTAVLFHHDPNHDDDRMDEIAALAAAARPGTLTAIEGETIYV